MSREMEEQQKHNNYTFRNCTAIILAGGLAERMGSDKRFLKLGDENIIERHVRILKKHFPHVLISANDPEALQHLGVDVIRDENLGRGPLEGLTSALTVSPTNCNFVVAVDIPKLDIQLMKRMWEENGHGTAIVPIYADGNQEPLFAFYDKSVVPIFRGALSAGELAIHKALQQCSVYHFPMNGEIAIRNLNEPQDYLSFLRSGE